MMRSILQAFVLGGIVFAFTGCGPSVATVSGTVTYQGKKVIWGGVSVVAADGTVHTAEIKTDGTYSIASVPVGAAKVGVSSPDPLMGQKPNKPPVEGSRYKPPTLPPGAWFAIPEKFSNANGSGLTLQVGSGSGDLDIK